MSDRNCAPCHRTYYSIKTPCPRCGKRMARSSGFSGPAKVSKPSLPKQRERFWADGWHGRCAQHGFGCKAFDDHARRG